MHGRVVIADWQVKKQLFGIDNKGMSAEVAVKNELRRTIKVRRASYLR